MKRITELVNEVRRKHPKDDFLSNFESSCEENPLKRNFYRSYERALASLDEESWLILKEKAINHFRDHRPGQLKTGFFNQLNEAFAYSYLVDYGFANVKFLREGRFQQADLGFVKEDRPGLCEVKSIGISDDEISRRSSNEYIDSSVNSSLSPEFLTKLNSTIDSAKPQIAAYPDTSFVYVVIEFDDFTRDFLADYRAQLETFVSTYPTRNLILQVDRFGSIIKAVSRNK